MAFSISGHNLPSCHDYESAVRVFEKAPDWGRHSGRHYNERRMTTRADRDHMGVRLSTAGDVIFRYHSTDVVTWHKDNTFTIRPWASVSTSIFIKAFTPTGVYAQMTHGAGPLICCYRQGPDYERYGHKIYVIYNRATFERDNQTNVWVCREGNEPISYPRVSSRRDARLALVKYNFHGFAHWLPAALEILKPRTTVRVTYPDNQLEKVSLSLNDTRFGYLNIVEAISDRSLWPAFLMARDLKPSHEPYKSYWGRSMAYTTKRHVAMILKATRAAIYAHEGVIENSELAYATSWDQLRAARAACSLYGVY